MLDENVDGHLMLLVLLVDKEGLPVQPMLGRNPGDIRDVVVGELIDVAHDLALVRADSSEHQQVLQVLVLAERRRLKDDLLEQLDKLNRQVGGQEGLDRDRDIVGVCAFRQCGCNNLFCMLVMRLVRSRRRHTWSMS